MPDFINFIIVSPYKEHVSKLSSTIYKSMYIFTDS